MAFENLKAVLRSGADPRSKFKLLLAAAAISRPVFRPIALPLLRRLAAEGVVRFRYHKFGRTLQASLRLADLPNDLLSFYELGAGDCYRLREISKKFFPDYVIDGGGNIGMFALGSLALWPDALCLILEPVEDNRARIKAHLDDNHLGAELRASCLGAQPGRMKFFCRDAMRGSLYEQDPFSQEVDVDVVTLSQLVRDLPGWPAIKVFIKLDIEGAEIEVLEEFFTSGAVPAGCQIVGELHHWPVHKEKFLQVLARAHWNSEFFCEDSVCVLFHAYHGRI